ncbi:MAG TPA: transcriptional regulator [Bacteroidales bacterium]|nr:transcriptional regulator [Bacteroidales bacterium]
METDMKDIIHRMDKMFDNRYRFCIMTLLKRDRACSYMFLQNSLQVTCGALSSHLNFLENAKYIKTEKKFINRKPNTSYSLTESGIKSFTDYKKDLTLLINI